MATHSSHHPHEKKHDKQHVYCLCPTCGVSRKKIGKYWTILKRGKERNGMTRYLCRSCQTWFNDKTGKSMHWLSR